ncbi:glycosyltransferase family 4 protein [Niveispirillum sp. KHB5.9]|uniref:glycosyltransferase family 4 protein n=1 Tax=Niveispirillum sp. KHB5.9 TaxID=3400269 RepID=UPI003A8A7959
MTLPVTFSHDIFTSQAVGGISRYFVELALALSDSGREVEIAAGRHRNRHLGAVEAPWINGRYEAPTRLPAQALRLRNEVWAALSTRHHGILHRTYYPLLDLMGGRRPLVTTVHDMVWELFPGEARSFAINSNLKRRAVDRADLIIAPTEATKRDLCRLWSVGESRVHVVNHGFTAPALPPDDGRHLLGGRPYVLFVGRRGGYKNFANFLKGYAQSALPGRGISLLCFGGGDFGPADHALLAETGMEDHVTWMGGDDATMMRAYRDASLFVYPSRCEGFGLPVLEAMAVGCPVAIAAEDAALVEVAGGAALTYDAGDPAATAHLLESTLDDGALRETLVARGRVRVSDFGWDRCASETAALYALLG